MIMMSLLTVQNIIHQNQNEVSGLHQGIFFDITQKDKENLSSEEGVQSIGLSCNIKTVEQNSKELSLIYYDDTMFNLIPDFEGKYPEQSNEIAVTDAFFEGENVPAKINTTIQLNLDGTVKKYTIVGIYHDQDASAYPVFVSFAKCQELRGNDLLNGYVWLENADTFTKDEAEELLSQISENTGLKDWTVSSYYDYVNAGLSYEVLKLLAKSQSKILLPVKAPGFLLQRLTTREPDDSMLEVAIAAFNSVYQMDADPSIPESEFTVSMTVRKYVETLKEKFKAASIDESDAEWLVACSSGIARSELYTSEKMFVPTEVSRMDKIARERLGGRPLWYILGDTEFYGYKIKVDERVLIPRPETELLAEIAVKTYEEGDKVLDLCTGSGAVAIAIAKQKNISVAAADVSADALALAEENARANGADVKFVESDLFAKIKGKYNIITCNPPYVKSADMKTLPKEVGFEPAMALDGGEDGLDFYRRLAKESPKHLVRGGALIMECGIGQAQEIVKLFSKFDYTMVTRDLEGVERIVRAVY